MALPGGVEAVFNVALRVPPLFLLDSVLNKSFLAFLFPFDPNDPQMTWADYVVNIWVLGMSFYWNQSFVIEFLFAWFFYMAWDVRRTGEVYSNTVKTVVQSAVHLSFISPMLIQALFRDWRYFEISPFLAIVYPVIQISQDLIDSFSNILFTFKRMYNIIKVTVSAIGLQAFLEDQWTRLFVPTVLRGFCMLRLCYQISLYLYSIYYNFPPPRLLNSTVEYENRHENLTVIFQNLLVRSCETSIALLGTTSCISFIAHYIGLFMAFIVGSDTEEDRNMGTVSAILFFLLALQTGLTGLEPEKRLVRLYRNFALLSAAILHFVHSMLNPILLALSASRSTAVKKHARALGMCLFLIVYPVCLVTYLWQRHSASPWLLAVTAFSIEVIIKVFVSLTVYTLFIIDAYRETFWEKLDDYVYYITSAGNTIEFLFGIFMFCNGGWIMVFESGGAIRAIMMCVHAYLNIFVQAKEGWKVFMKRRTAVNKINSLREATVEELEKFNDVCAICYQELKSARVTCCNHFYHSVCLRKWLYVQDNCPLCHEMLYKPPGEEDSEKPRDTGPNMDDANQNNVPNGRPVPRPALLPVPQPDVRPHIRPALQRRVNAHNREQL
ncbi:TRC8-like protein [Mya arenaria]|uniref:TRC8-like protein n=1 Tax=Mya arenaria TaxID=6604 RepID=A0ABY7FGZ0_MYAAR|nr:TRC8-like protein [Mya arenaria]